MKNLLLLALVAFVALDLVQGQINFETTERRGRNRNNGRRRGGGRRGRKNIIIICLKFGFLNPYISMVS